MHNNFMYQDPSEGPSILNVNAILEGEIEYRRQFLAKAKGESYDFSAFNELRRGVELSLNLAYNEPWGQMQPVGHILGPYFLSRDISRKPNKYIAKISKAMERQHVGSSRTKIVLGSKRG